MATGGLSSVRGSVIDTTKGSSSLDFHVVSQTPDFDGLRAAWDGLVAQTSKPHLFLRFDWWLNAWRLYAQKRGFCLYLLTGWSDDRLVLVLPLTIDNRVLRMLSSGTLEYRDAIVLPSENSASWVDQAWSFVRASVEADIYILQNLRLPNALAQRLASDPSATEIGGGWCPVIRLDDFPDWDAYALTLPKSMLSDQRRQWKRIRQAMPGVAFKVIDQPESVPGIMDWIARHKIAWGEARRKDAVWFTDSDIQLALKSAAELGLKDGTFVLAVLCDGETIISAGWGHHHGDEFLFHAFAYDPAFAKYSPSRLYLECLVKHCMARGVKTFDFMPGEEAYKGIWATDYVRTVSYIGAFGWKGRALLRLASLKASNRVVPDVARRLFKMLPEPGRRAVRRLVRNYQMAYDALRLKLPPPAGASGDPSQE